MFKQVNSPKLLPGLALAFLNYDTAFLCRGQTHKHTTIERDAGVRIINVVDTTVVEHAWRITLIYPAVGKVDGIGVHDPSHTGR